METKSVRDLMVTMSTTSTVKKDATLYEAVNAFDQAGQAGTERGHAPRNVLVVDDAGRPLGKLSDLDVMRSLEPAYRHIGDLRTTNLSGMSTRFLRSMLQGFHLWQDPLGALCEKAADIRVGDIDYMPITDPVLHEDDHLNMAIHLMVTGRHASLLVMDKDGKQAVGVLHRSDVFMEVRNRILACEDRR
ncbi:MAG: CBS domain-containing protein [Deltaproteobacteria bacterium]|nr:CBS domain-containing protein [Deltaproteobacteria bacterium]